LYKGTRPGFEGIQNRLGRFIDRGLYSHTELLFSDGLSASSSFIDKGVRTKPIGYSSVGSWDFLPIPDPGGEIEQRSRQWFLEHDGLKYDILGNIRFATNFARDSLDKWFCSESCMAALGFPEAFRYGPSGAATLLQHYYRTEIIEVYA
jgi:hypothetical protein